MDFTEVFQTVSSFLDEKKIRYAVIGGVALASYGFVRNTEDLDLVVEASGQNAIIQFLESRGYRTLHRSTGYSNHLHSDPALGRIDFVYMGEETSRKLFAECRFVKGTVGDSIPLPKPEHLVAMKVLAIKNDPARTFQDLADIRFLITLPGVDHAEIRSYFERNGMQESFHDLEKTL
jgi:hypothetical protein